MATKKIDLKPAVAKTQAQNALSSMLGGGSASGRVVDIDVDLLVPWSSEQFNQDVQPFDMYAPDELRDLANSVRRNGVQQPIIVRPLGDKYQILAGHNRTEAAKLADLKMIPAIIRDVDEATAMLIVVDTNLNQRQEIKPSQKAHAYQLRNDVIAAQGKSNKRSTAEIAEMTGENLRQVQRFLRLNALSPALLALVDADRVSVRAGVNLSYLTKEQQSDVARHLKDRPDMPVQIAEAETLKEIAQSGAWSGERVREILHQGQQRAEEVKKQKKEKRGQKPAKEQAASPEQESIALPESSATNGRIIPLPFSEIAKFFDDPNPTDAEVVTVIRAHFDYLQQQFGDRFMSIYRTEQMAVEE